MNRRVIYHIAFWIAYALFKTYLQFDFTRDSVTLNLFSTALLAQFVLLAVKIPMVYLLFSIIDKYLLRQWALPNVVLSVLGVLVLGIAFFLPIRQYIVYGVIYGTPVSIQAALNLTSILSTTFILSFVSGIAVAIKMIRYSNRQREAQQEMVKVKLETELQYLKAQINPHFLFNTLNNIYALARKKADETPEVIMKLSRLFRFILYEAQKRSIAISEEIQVLQNYIELERIRYNEKLSIDLSENIDDRAQQIAPLILLPFVENAFKHGASESRFDSYIRIRIELRQGRLLFVCINSKAEELSKTGGQIGLGNIRRQLELVYPDHHLEIDNTDTEFKVTLKLDLKILNNPNVS